MNSAQDPGSPLQRLLALKRCERPPADFFQTFPDKVHSQLESELLAGEPPWWRQWTQWLSLNPLTACACGLVITGIVTIGFGLSQPADDDRSSSMSMVVAASLVEATLTAENLESVRSETAPARFWQTGSSFGPALLAGPALNLAPDVLHSGAGRVERDAYRPR